MVQTVQKTVEVPQIQYEDQIVQVPVQKQVQVPVVQKVQKTVKVPQIQYEDEIVQVPVTKQVQVPMVQKVQKTVEVPQVQYEDQIIQVPVAKHVHVPMVQKVQKTIEVPQVQYEDQIVDVPVQKQVHVPMVQKVQKTVEVPSSFSTRIRWCMCLSRSRCRFPWSRRCRGCGGSSGPVRGSGRHVPVQKHVHVPMVQTVQKTVEVLSADRGSVGARAC